MGKWHEKKTQDMISLSFLLHSRMLVQCATQN